MAKLLKIDDLTRPNHPYLSAGDECYYLLEYTPHQGHNYSTTNQLILNLKKSVDRRGKPEYFYKSQAINQAGNMLRQVLSEDNLTTLTCVPIPCSKSKGHALYDDRMVQVLRRMTYGLPADVRELIVQREDLEGFHAGYRMPPHELSTHYELDESLCDPKPRAIVFFDDMLTTGCHLKAAQSVVAARWPDMPTAGIFIARVLRPDPEPDTEIDFAF